MVAHTSDLSTREAKAGNSKSEASIGYLVRPYVKKKNRLPLREYSPWLCRKSISDIRLIPNDLTQTAF